MTKSRQEEGVPQCLGRQEQRPEKQTLRTNRLVGNVRFLRFFAVWKMSVMVVLCAAAVWSSKLCA
jgi:hypothetical protein